MRYKGRFPWDSAEFKDPSKVPKLGRGISFLINVQLEEWKNLLVST
jgi:hypothetical protein